MSDESFPELFFAVWWLLVGWLDAAKKICARYAGRMQVGPSSLDDDDDEVGRAWKVQHLIMIGRCQPPSSSSSASSSLEVGARTTRSEAEQMQYHRHLPTGWRADKSSNSSVGCCCCCCWKSFLGSEWMVHVCLCRSQSVIVSPLLMPKSANSVRVYSAIFRRSSAQNTKKRIKKGNKRSIFPVALECSCHLSAYECKCTDEYFIATC